MSKLTEMHAQVLGIARKVQSESENRQDPEQIKALSEACQRLASAYQLMRETELHEEFHMNDKQVEEVDFPLPGENPIKGSN